MQTLPKNDLAIVREEALALLPELQGDVSAAIVHREREIKLTERLHKEAQSPGYTDSTRSYMLRDRGAFYLQERRAILAALKSEQPQHKPRIARTG